MEANVDVISINGVEYVKKGAEVKEAVCLDGMKYVICRSYAAGVFAGYLQSRNGREVVMRKARRLWYWDGAASLSQLAMEGVNKPQNCKFPCEVDCVELLEVSEILNVTEKAQKSIQGVKVWEQ